LYDHNSQQVTSPSLTTTSSYSS